MSRYDLSNALLDNNYSGDYRMLLVQANQILIGDEQYEARPSQEIIGRLLANEDSIIKQALIAEIAQRVLLK